MSKKAPKRKKIGNLLSKFSTHTRFNLQSTAELYGHVTEYFLKQGQHRNSSHCKRQMSPLFLGPSLGF